jgi:cytochrome c biogenesis protein CcdA
MLRRIGVALSVGFADSLNPSTVGPALYLATVPRPIRRVIEFTTGVFAVNFAAGAVLSVGPGRALLDLTPHPRGTVKHVIELVAGAALLAAAAALWAGRRRLARKELPMRGGGGSSALITGASIAALELPTAVPYLAVIAGIAASNASVPEQIGLVALYNFAFVLPLLAIVAVLVFAGQRAADLLQRGGAWLQRRWPVVLAGLLLFVGSLLTILGGSGLARP